MIVERYAADRPSRLKRAIVSVDADERYRWLRGVAGLEHGAGLGVEVEDYASRRIRINDRVVEHVRAEPQRAPYLAWAEAALRTPLEVWRGYRPDEDGHLEARLYFLFATSHPAIHNIVVIVSEHDQVVFNLIPFEPKDAKKFRSGELVYVGYDDPFGRCPHGCCERAELA